MRLAGPAEAGEAGRGRKEVVHGSFRNTPDLHPYLKEIPW